MSDEGYTPGPRADYVCTRCEEKGHVSSDEPWRDLPVKDARCPKCGAKKFMQRMWSGRAPGVGTGLVAKTDQFLARSGYDEQMAAKYRGWRRPRVAGGPVIVAPDQLEGTMARMTGGRMRGIANLAPGEARATNRPLRALGGPITNMPSEIKGERFVAPDRMPGVP
jgi:DNA-directed RNA polymerase subunit RPC12/RpoP